MRRFSVWVGTTINPAYHTLRDMAWAARALMPPGRWTLEILLKAGEGGSWQARRLHPTWGDPHPLALDGMGKLIDLYRQGQHMRPRVRVTPYVVVRGEARWNAAEWQQIAEAAFVGNRVVLNLEEGSAYWNGPTDPAELRGEYLEPMAELVKALAPRAKIEVCAIPRRWVVDLLGGLDSLREWARVAHSMSWECYGSMAPDLRVHVAIPRVENWLLGKPARYRIPVVQRGEIGRWAATAWASHGLQCWHLDAD